MTTIAWQGQQQHDNDANDDDSFSAPIPCPFTCLRPTIVLAFTLPNNFPVTFV
ncbi:hypothetical protein BKA82DRAFT_1006004 [Pisolithus tinctorius]|uniref:Uncharacterized protein n=1 Tax=Pisolithus tinctorius Marx 270 TaxID=870435 RepID=A0A0C3IKV3_PISTI|nr:hypothetical protein BKA82DRAFT_1006004 [Pisolithus tinctorius]KIN97602.1 hypothetical protein M404DRAFT_1006004 [Pisolithus tinctorius Marx 270]